MADIAVVATGVKFRLPDDKTEQNYPYQGGLAGEAILAGQAVYRKSLDSKVYLARAEGSNSEEADCIGISANHAYVDQPVSVCGPQGDVALGVDLSLSEPIYLSINYGGLIYKVDLATPMIVVRIGDATETTNVHIEITNFGYTIP